MRKRRISFVLMLMCLVTAFFVTNHCLALKTANTSGLETERQNDRRNGWGVTSMYHAGFDDAGYAAVRTTCKKDFKLFTIKTASTAQGKTNSFSTEFIARPCYGFAQFSYNGVWVTEWHLYESVWTASQSYTSILVPTVEVKAKGILRSEAGVNLTSYAED